MASGPINLWQIDGETVETVADFILGGSKITADGDCSHEIKRHLLHGAKDVGLIPWVGKIPWRRKWQPTPVFLLGKSHGQRSLAGYSPWGHKESDMTEQLSTHALTPLRIEIIEAHQEWATFFPCIKHWKESSFQYQGEASGPLMHVL